MQIKYTYFSNLRMFDVLTAYFISRSFSCGAIQEKTKWSGPLASAGLAQICWTNVTFQIFLSLVFFSFFFFFCCVHTFLAAAAFFFLLLFLKSACFCWGKNSLEKMRGELSHPKAAHHGNSSHVFAFFFFCFFFTDTCTRGRRHFRSGEKNTGRVAATF